MPVDVFKDMNAPQREAIAHSDGPLLVIAGAGSGKTRVITHRIANLIQQGTRPDRILAITFTNKAAGEMQERVEKLLGLRTPWITTFHSAGLRLLKLEHDKLGLEHPFTILDEDDQKRLMKRVCQECHIDPKETDPKSITWQISTWKNRLLEPHQVKPAGGGDDALLKAYKRYVELCRDECVLDFDDLLLWPVKLLSEDDDLRKKYVERFPYILIDEYQDTNSAQYALIQLLGSHTNVCATGDPDQAIYGWRGADLNNILNFERDFPGCKTVLLEQNYRSTKTILRAAQSVVEHNTKRREKTIFSEKEVGSQIVLITVDDQDDESMAIAAAAERVASEGRKLSDIAVFYRTNAQSRSLEEWLIRRGVPYRIVGGTRFYDRREVKDLLAYAKLLVNPRDLQSLLRIVNVPRRGVGERTVELVRDLAYEEGVSVHEVLMTDDLLDRIAVGRSARPLRNLAGLLRRLQALDQLDAGACIERILDLTELEAWHLENDPEQGQERAMNIRELVTAAEQYQSANPAGNLEGFLDHVSLITAADAGVKNDEDQLILMTLHASKGLEFPVVFIAGCEQGVLPLVRQGAPCDYEEERRLMYVGITRAQESLYLSRAVCRSMYGRTVRNPPSMFLAEVPDECIEHRDRTRRYTDGAAGGPDAQAGPSYPRNSIAGGIVSSASDYTAPSKAPVTLDTAKAAGLLTSGSALKAALASGRRDDDAVPFTAGARIVHGTLGPGTVQSMTGEGHDRRLVVDFDDGGEKELLWSFAARQVSPE